MMKLHAMEDEVFNKEVK
ncbi:hypothetical protein A2U01_0093742, partial [Trifolium medium]|nr:hypothetical protein [Trifolium medium]